MWLDLDKDNAWKTDHPVMPFATSEGEAPKTEMLFGSSGISSFCYICRTSGHFFPTKDTRIQRNIQ